MNNQILGKIFMLDDDIFFLDLYKELLEARGYEVFTTTNAYKFLLYTKEIHPDVIVLDVNMPDVSGWEVLQLLAQEVKESAPVLMTTIEADKELAVAKGVAHYLPKPISLEKFMEIIESYCGGKRNHDILLLDDYDPFSTSIRDAMTEFGLNYFEVNDLKATELYLNKNLPKFVCVNYERDRFENAKSKIKHDKIIFVENKDNIKNIVSLL